MTRKTYIFECNSDTYMTCIEKSIFASNKPWPLEIRDGDYCLLHHYEIGALLGLWTAGTDGGRNLAKLWGGRFPFQVKVLLAVPKVIEVPKLVLAGLGMDATTGRFNGVINPEIATAIHGAFAKKGNP